MNLPKFGAKVRTKPQLGNTLGMMINPRHLQARRPNAEGTYIGFVPGHGGDVWWVEHGPEDVAAYCFNELTLRRERTK